MGAPLCTSSGQVLRGAQGGFAGASEDFPEDMFYATALVIRGASEAKKAAPSGAASYKEEPRQCTR
jgi:hypothetical protein